MPRCAKITLYIYVALYLDAGKIIDQRAGAIFVEGSMIDIDGNTTCTSNSAVDEGGEECRKQCCTVSKAHQTVRTVLIVQQTQLLFRRTKSSGKVHRNTLGRSKEVHARLTGFSAQQST